MREIFTTLIFGLFFGVSVFGQVSQSYTPASNSLQSFNELDFINLEPIENIRSTSQNTFPLYAGYVVPFDVTSLQQGVWDETADGILVWRLGIHIRSAQALNVYFKNLELEAGDKLYIYYPGVKYMLGAFTSINNDRFLGTEFIPGDSIIIEFNTTNTNKTIPFLIDMVGVSVNPLQEATRDFGDSGPCEVLMNCPEGANFQDQKKGIARVLVREGSSLFWCSGSLVNNTNRDGTPYFLTAHHCGEDASDSDYSQWVFYFNYESINCEMPALEPQHQSISGAKLVADGKSTSSGSDFKLLLLEEDIPENYKPYFNGWSRSTSPSSNGTGIHHPDGDLKMVSTYTNPLVSTRYNNPEPDANGRFWKVVWSETQSGHGVTEGGSSGSPIFNPEGYIVGTLSGGRASCTKLTQPDYYGKFDIHWESNGTDSTAQLKPWLDPLGSDVPTLIGLDLDSSNITADFDSDRTLIKVGEGIQFNDKSQGEIISHKWEFPGGDPEFVETANPPLIYYYKTGDYNVKLVVKSADESDSLTVVSYLRVVPNIYPNPSANGNFNITFGESVPADLEIEVFSIDGRQIQYVMKQTSENAISVDLSAQPQGIYIIQLKTEDNTQIIKVANKTFINSSK